MEIETEKTNGFTLGIIGNNSSELSAIEIEKSKLSEKIMSQISDLYIEEIEVKFKSKKIAPGDIVLADNKIKEYYVLSKNELGISEDDFKEYFLEKA